MVKVFPSRIIPVLRYVKGPDVLDIGCVGMGENDQMGGVDFIFGELHKAHLNVIGLDIDDDGAKRMNKQGYKVIVHDAQQKYNLKQKFDTVVSEENIEHIANLKTYLDNVKRHMKKDGLFVLSTPNASCFDFMIQTWLFGKPQVNQHHTHVHTLDTITYLLESNGFKIMTYEYIQGITTAMNFNAQILKYLLPLIPNRMARTLVVVAKNATR